MVSDLAYGALGYQGYENPSFLSTPGAKDVGIEFYTFSKTFNMAGWRLAFAAGNDQMIEALNLIQDHLFVGIFPALQEAGIAALLDTKSEEAVVQLNTTYDSRRDAFVQAAAKIGWQAFHPEVLSMLGCLCQRVTPVRVLRIFCLRGPCCCGTRERIWSCG